MSSLFSLKEDIIKESQEYYNAKSNEDKTKHKENLQKSFKKFHKFRYSQKNDYQFVEKLIKNIIQGGNYICTENQERNLVRK